jgi:hypothetical protein
MACNINLFSLIPNEPVTGAPPLTGGTWKYIGDGEGGGADPASFDVGNGAENFPINSEITDGATNQSDALEVDFSPTATGTYVFEYTVAEGSCEISSLLTITVVQGVAAVNGDTPGSALVPNVCASTDTEINLMNILANGTGTNGVTQGGTWTGSGTTSGGYTPGTASSSDDTFNPSQVLEAEFGGNDTLDLIFTYTVSVDDTVGGCDNCTDEASITFTITDSPSAGGPGTATVCNSEVAA